MLITERKRALYDQQGILCKMDILRSVRRRDIACSEIADNQVEREDMMKIQGGRKQYQKYVEVVLMVAIVVAVVWLFLIAVRKGQVLEMIHDGMGITPDISSTLTLGQIKRMMPLNQSAWVSLHLKILKELSCTADGAILNCQIQLQLN